jgi:hypothetical protein
MSKWHLNSVCYRPVPIQHFTKSNYIYSYLPDPIRSEKTVCLSVDTSQNIQLDEVYASKNNFTL